MEAYSLLGRIYASINLLPRAKDYFTMFLNKSPNALAERFHLGLVQKDMGDIDSAMTTWDLVLQQQPHYPPALYNKANTLFTQDKASEATELLNLLLETAHEKDEHRNLAEKLLSRITLQ